MRKTKGHQIYFEYKDPIQLSKYITDGGKIVPARISKFHLAAQKRLNEAIKRARNLALLPCGIQAYDDMPKYEPVSPVPFSLD
ncbi:MAG: 30S ribosomal protein S18 [Bdellovibrionaceae bacterium]|nr:30S ribosomal protein S18 [Pseudobdellovibrionaceae bacterium]MDW8190477.1 30S ribosomal protein S18 [Pseudobdellovibrionaceae bacterium]